MNFTHHGRWNRYKEIGGETHKMCNGPLHHEQGEFMPLRSFFIMKKGPRAGKPISRCMACERVYRGRDAEGGLVDVDKVWFVFMELQFRIGKAETCRRLGVSSNLWMRLDNRIYEMMYRKTAKKAMELLQELREDEVVRHKDSIRHGSAKRGQREKQPQLRRDFNGKDDLDSELHRMARRKFNSKHLTQVTTIN